MKRDLLRLLAAAALAAAVGGTAAAQYPQGVRSGTAPQASAALTTLAIPAVVGLNVGHNFVLDFRSATKCWGAASTRGTFPQSPTGATTYTFAVSPTSIPNTSNVTCPAAGAQPDVATVQVFSTLSANSRLRAQITNGGTGAQATAFTGLITDIFTANRLRLSIQAADTCGNAAGKVSPLNLRAGVRNQVTGIPRTGWVNCRQTLELVLAANTRITAGTATGTLRYTMVSP